MKKSVGMVVYDLFIQSVVIQGLLSLLFVTLTCYLWLKGFTVPEDLIKFDWVVLGFYFGSKLVISVLERVYK